MFFVAGSNSLATRSSTCTTSIHLEAFDAGQVAKGFVVEITGDHVHRVELGRWQMWSEPPRPREGARLHK